MGRDVDKLMLNGRSGRASSRVLEPLPDLLQDQYASQEDHPGTRRRSAHTVMWPMEGLRSSISTGDSRSAVLLNRDHIASTGIRYFSSMSTWPAK